VRCIPTAEAGALRRDLVKYVQWKDKPDQPKIKV